MLKWLCLVLLIALSINNLKGQTGFHVLHIDSRKGLPQNHIHYITFDKNGFMWGLSEMGIFRYDGIRFTEFKANKNSQLLDNNYSGFIQMFNGDLAIADIHGGVIEIDSANITKVSGSNINKHEVVKINGLFPDLNTYSRIFNADKTNINKDGQIELPLVYTFNKRQHLTANNHKVFFYLDNKLSDSITLPDSNCNWIFLSNRLFYFNNSNDLFELKFDAPNFVATQPVFSEALKRKKNDKLKIFTNDAKGSCLQINNSVYYVTIVNNLIVSKLIIDSLPQRVDITNIIYCDKNKAAVVSTTSTGIFIYKAQPFKSIIYNGADINATNSFYSQVYLDSTTILTDWNLEVNRNGAQKSKRNIHRNYEENILRHNNFLYYCHGDSLLKFDLKTHTKKLVSYSKQSRPYTFTVHADSIIVGYRKKICVLRHDTIQTLIDFSKYRYSNNPFRIYVLDKDHLFFCAYKGAYICNLQTQIIDTLKPLQNQLVHNAEMHQGFLIIGTYANGFYLYINKQLVKMPLDEAGYLATTNSFLIDSQNNIWIGTNKGLYKTDFNTLIKYFYDNTTTVYYTYYNEDDGMLTSEFNGGCTSSALQLKNGYASMVSMNGLVWFKPEQMQHATLNNNIYIDKIWFDNALTDKALETIPKQTEHINIELATAYWGHPQNLQLAYRIKGFSKIWKPIDAERKSIYFYKPPAGNYVLEIRKCIGNKANEFALLSIPFSVEQKLVESNIFIVAICLAILTFILVVVKLVTQNIQRKNRLLENKVLQRTNELQVANNQLKQSIVAKDKLISIVSHEIVTPLRFLAMVAKQTGSKPMSEKNWLPAMNDIKNTSESLYNNAQNILNWIKHQNKRFNVTINHIALSGFCDEITTVFNEMAFAKNIHFKNEIADDTIIKSDKNILGIIVNNLFSNAVKFTENGTITITCQMQTENFTLTITDTGTGINQQQMNRIHGIIQKNNTEVSFHSDSSGNNGLGYLIIVDLLSLLNGSIAISSKLNEGTKVTLTLPIQ